MDEPVIMSRAWPCGLEEKIETLEAENARLRQALEDIANPLQRLQRGLPEGHKLDGHMITSLLNSVELYKSLAREALAKIKE